MTSPRNIAILGSTGSIGQQALEVIRRNREDFRVAILSAHNNASLLCNQALEFQPAAVIIGNEQHASWLKNQLSGMKTHVFSGASALQSFMQFADFDILLNALVGISGLKPALEAIKNGKTVALANKECLVAAGHLIMQLSRQHNALILPVDSEQTAIHQCLQGENPEHVEKIVLTASGGPFRGMTKAQLEKVTATEALKHPNWNMGDKISIDSATMMNKGMEVIASRWLFDLTTEQIEVVHHPQSVVHALVQFIDGSMKAQLSQPDMRLPVQYALFYPDRSRSAFPRLNFREQLSLTFRQINPNDFPCMQLATEASAIGGNIPCAMNAANEVAVQAFLQQKIGFLQIPDIIRQCMENATYNKNPGLDDIIKTDRAIQTLARDIIKTIPPPNR